MTKKAHLHMYRMAAALLAVALLWFGQPAQAAGENAAAVASRLRQLQNAHIDPAWPPDIEANAARVEALLQDFQNLTPEEREELTSEQLEDLRAYFATLYSIQGKAESEVDALFAPADASVPSSESISASEPAPASSLPVVPPPAPIKPASEADLSASVPAPVSQPQQEGWLNLFGNMGFGSMMLFILILLAISLFVRFLLALRQNKQEGSPQEDVTAQELFGDSYTQPPEEAKPVAPPQRINPPLLLDEPEKPQEPVPVHNQPPRYTPAPAKGLGSGGWSKSPQEEAPPPRSAATTSEAQQTAWDLLMGEQPSKKEPAWPETGEKEEPLQPLPEIGSNPDRQNPISMRSFSPPPRTGRPNKMPFRQGDPDDLDAIDE